MEAVADEELSSAVWNLRHGYLRAWCLYPGYQRTVAESEKDELEKSMMKWMPLLLRVLAKRHLREQNAMELMSCRLQY